MPEEAVRQYVADINGGRYELHRPIGRGGQGTVYTCKANPRIALKLLHSTSEAQAEMLRQRMALVKRMDLNGLPIARPIAMLTRPQVGYVMEFVAGMESMSKLVCPPQELEGVREWYTKSGGLRRRLRVLHRLAKVLSSVHGRGLVYGDPSPGNVLVSQEGDSDDVYLIDSDNMRYSSRPDKAVLFTPGYGAPELVLGRSGMNSLTDSHAFAVIAFQCITLCHPLLGDTVRDGPPSMEEAALQGRVPWIDHPNDDRNRCGNGIPRSLVLSKLLSATFERTFNTGLGDPTERPGMTAWADALQTVSRVTLVCQACGWSYYFTEDVCPVCQHSRPRYALATVGIWDLSDTPGGALCAGPNNRPLIVGSSVGTQDHPLAMTREQLGLPDGKPDVALVVQLDGVRIAASCVAIGCEMSVATTPGSPVHKLTDVPQTFRLSNPSSSLYIHCGAMSARHRVARISVRGGAES
jgi:DNA-binding helix-hairpin-helix protein with protein kinase domain